MTLLSRLGSASSAFDDQIRRDLLEMLRVGPYLRQVVCQLRVERIGTGANEIYRHRSDQGDGGRNSLKP
jgi:hypothetical protein